LLPALVQLPIAWVYPTGSKQEKITPKFGKAYGWADTICGDGHYIRRFMPARLDGKAVVTTTTTRKDVEQFRERGVRLLVTTTPEFNGRSPGTNVLEAAIVAVLGRPPEQVGPDDYLQALRAMEWKPNIVRLADGQKAVGS